MENNYDIIVIGAGIGGLTTAALLSRKKKKVLLIERNNIPGGYAINFKRGDFDFDASLHLMQGCNAKGVVKKILRDCGCNVNFILPKTLCRSIYPDYDVRLPQADINNYCKLLKRLFPENSSGIMRFASEMEQIFNSLANIKSRLPSRKVLDNISKSCSDILGDHLGHNPRLEAMIMQLWPYFALPPSKLSGLYFAYIWFDYVANGGFYPGGGAQRISDSLASAILRNGGEIIYGDPVERISILENTAQGVITRKGNQYSAKIVVSNCDAQLTFDELIDRKFIPEPYISKIKNMEPSISAFQVYLGLDIDLRKIGINDYEIFINPGYDLEKQYSDSVNNIFETVPFSVTIYSNLTKPLIPMKQSVAIITCLAGFDYWKDFSREEYLSKKNKLADMLIKRTEKALPGLTRHIKFVNTASPLTMKRYTGNYKGATAGWAQTVDQSAINRLDCKTPIRNLYLVGHWTRPGGGISGVMYSAELLTNKIINNH